MKYFGRFYAMNEQLLKKSKLIYIEAVSESSKRYSKQD